MNNLWAIFRPLWYWWNNNVVPSPWTTTLRMFSDIKTICKAVRCVSSIFFSSFLWLFSSGWRKTLKLPCTFQEKIPKISKNFQKFPKIPKNSPKLPKIPSKSPKKIPNPVRPTKEWFTLGKTEKFQRSMRASYEIRDQQCSSEYLRGNKTLFYKKWVPMLT